MMFKKRLSTKKVPLKETNETGETDLFWSIYEKYKKYQRKIRFHEKWKCFYQIREVLKCQRERDIDFMKIRFKGKA